MTDPSDTNDRRDPIDATDGVSATDSDLDRNDADPDDTHRDGSERIDTEGTGWPVRLRGVTESIVTTLGPNGLWNCAALGVHAESETGTGRGTDERDTDGGVAPVTAYTWGRTRTWCNFREEGEGYVQFVHDPVVFTEAALTIREERSPILDTAAAWVRVDASEIESGESDGTLRVEWALSARESEVLTRDVPTINRGHGAVIEATVAASRLDVAAYDTDELLDRLSYLEDVVERCGGPREREAFSILAETVGRRW